MILEIERSWGHDPGWFEGLDREDQERLLAWWWVHCDPRGEGSRPSPPGKGPRRQPELGARLRQRQRR